jgi:hypothetical protein
MVLTDLVLSSIQLTMSVTVNEKLPFSSSNKEVREL